MKKYFLCSFYIIVSLATFAQRGYWSPSGFIELRSENDSIFFVQSRPGKQYHEPDVLKKIADNTNCTVLQKVPLRLFISSKESVSDSSFYTSKEYSSKYGGGIYIMPRIALSIEKGNRIEEIIANYVDKLTQQKEEHGVYYFDCDVNTSDEVLDLASNLHQHPAVKWCEAVKNAPVIKCNALYSQQYYIKNNNGPDLNVEPAWITSNLSNIKVAVVDCGVFNNHEDMSNCILSGYTVGNPTGYGLPQNANSFDSKIHGTRCAGIIAAEDNSVGIKGVASGVKVVPINIFPNEGNSNIQDGRATEQEIHEAIIWASNHADVLSCSWIYPQYSYQIASAIDTAQVYGRNGKGTPVVFGSGNNGLNQTESVAFPAYLEKVIAVGSMKRNGEVGIYSQRGYGLDLVAFGGFYDIVTTDSMGSNVGTIYENYVENFMGTSAACAQVAGIVALMLSANPDLTEPEIRQLLYGSCQKLSGFNFTNGWNYHIGYGLADAAAAVAASLTMTGPVIPANSSTYYVNNLSNAVSVVWSWKNGSSVQILQNSPVSNQCTIQNSLKSYINDVLVATIKKDGNDIATVEKPIRTGANFSGIYKQEGGTILTPNGPINCAPIPETAFADNSSILIHREHRVTLKSPLFTTSTISVTGPTPSLALTQNGDSIVFFAPMTTQGAVYTFTGTNNNGYDVYKFTVRKIKDSLIPVSLGVTHTNGMLSLYFKNESDEVIDARDLQDYDVDVIVANVQTGKTVYSSSQKGAVRDISTKDWKAGIYCVQATIAGEQLSNKIIINK